MTEHPRESMDATDTTMHIGELAERTGLSLRTIRHYDEIGLLKPSGRTEGGFRLYTQPDLERLLLIRRMKPLGFALEEMTDLLRIMEAQATEKDDDPNVADQLAEYVTEARERRETLREELKMADDFIARLEHL